MQELTGLNELSRPLKGSQCFCRFFILATWFFFFLYPLPSLMACEPCCGVLYRVSSWGGLDAESAFKPCIPLHLTTSSFVCVLERGGLGVYPLASLSTMLLKRDTWLPNVSSRREPCFHLCPCLSFYFFVRVRVRWGSSVCDCDEKPEAIPL